MCVCLARFYICPFFSFFFFGKVLYLPLFISCDSPAIESGLILSYGKSILCNRSRGITLLFVFNIWNGFIVSYKCVVLNRLHPITNWNVTTITNLKNDILGCN